VSAIFALAALVLILPRSAAATRAEDFSGYSSAVLEREFKARAATVRLKDGVVTLVEPTSLFVRSHSVVYYQLQHAREKQ
jgi:hypothetical protein